MQKAAKEMMKLKLFRDARPTKALGILTALTILAGLFAFRNAPVNAGFPVTVIDDLGRTVTIPNAPTRIVCVSPGVTEIVYALGLGDKVVGVDIYSDYPPEVISKRRIRDIYTPDPDEIAALNPDVVIIYSFFGPGDPNVENLERLGVPLIVTCPTSFDDVFRDILLIGNATGRRVEAGALTNTLKERVKRVRDLTCNVTKKPKVYFEIWYPPIYTVGPGSWPHHLIEIAGGINIFGNASTSWVNPVEEEVIVAKPDIIITIRGMPGYHETLETIKMRGAGWEEIPAIKNGKVYSLDESLVGRPGPRLVDGLEIMAGILHPELFNVAATWTLDLNTAELRFSTQKLTLQALVRADIEVLKAANNGSLVVSALLSGPEVPKTLKLVGKYLKIECGVPSGLVFTLKVYYSKSELNNLGVSEESLKIYYWSEERAEWLPLESIVNRDEGYVKAVVDHLTYFALMGEAQPNVLETPIPLWVVLIVVGVLSLICVVIYIAARKH